jgi:hypothetical protein
MFQGGAISPDGQKLACTSNIDDVEATSTNNEFSS